MERKQYVCPKCGNMHYSADEFRATGNQLARMFDVQNKHFTTISCTQCGYTELYKNTESAGWDILDLLIG